MKYCRCLSLFTLLILQIFSLISQANSPADKIWEYITATYGDALDISNAQVEQLSWVLDNPVTTPEMAVVYQNGCIHSEVPRALARLYSLQLLRSGTQKDYQIFTSPQIKKGLVDKVLHQDNFYKLSRMFKALSPAEYETLQTGAVISSVVLSPEARKRASPFIPVIPEDSTRFLAATAPHVAGIYPLAKHLTTRYPESPRLLTTLFMPDSHLRHMMHCEGSMAMYSHITRSLREKTISDRELNLWYFHWIVNIAGFHGHLAPVGSLYLTKHTLALAQLARQAIDLVTEVPDANPLRFYLQEHSRWLDLPALTSDQNELIALGRLAALFHPLSTEQGKELFAGFRNLSADHQAGWIAYSLKQIDTLQTPSPTYVPALLCNCSKNKGLQNAIQSAVPIMLDAFAKAEQMRSNGTLAQNTPLSFREMAQVCSVKKIVNATEVQAVQVDGQTGLATLCAPTP